MRRRRCPVCRARVRAGRLREHMRAVHREGRGHPALVRFRLHLLAAGGILAVGLVATLLIQLSRQPLDEGGEEVGPVDPGATAVQFRTDDGFELKGVYYRTCSSAPLVILVHGLNEDRRAYDPIVPLLRSSGYNVLAFDSRGHGESLYQSGRRRPWADPGSGFTEEDFRAMHLDIVAAKQYAMAMFESAPLVAVVGASIGANEALQFAAEGQTPEVRALVLLSPGSDYRGVESGPPARTLSERGDVAVLFAASQGDSASMSCAIELHAAFLGPRELDVQPGDAHGTGLLSNAELRQKLLDFLKEHL
ncbi:MAG: alpha/beta hydrolase [Thermoplasmatota archaeon]